MGPLMGFILERSKSLISKKLGAAAIAEVGAVGTPLQGVPLLLWIVVQAAEECFKYFVDKRYG